MRIAFLMDPYPSLNLETDTSLLCMEALLARGHDVYWLERDDLSLLDAELVLRLRPVRNTAPFQLGDESLQAADFIEALMIRPDPPVDSGYLQLTWLLDFLPASVVCLNNPVALRSLNEKLFALRWPALSPPTLMTRDPAALSAFLQAHQQIVIKPLAECSGRGIKILNVNDGDKDQQVAEVIAQLAGGEFLLAQRFLPGVVRGDKRIFLIQGEAAGQVNRIPRTARQLANIHQGAHCEATGLTERDGEIIAMIGPVLIQHGIVFAGIDVIDGWLTEINITSPSAVRQINAVSGLRLEQQLADAIEATVQRHSLTG
ncbi:MAG: glutathione synthase [Pseudomonadales bacterium]|nr:glutathione synthase [Pseudomonadales bacterium]